MAAPARRWAAELLHFWFYRLTAGQRFGANDAVDAEMARRFGPDLLALHSCAPEDFLSDPLTALAAVILFDQVPRNVLRGTAGAFAFDPLARAITYGALARGLDVGLRREQRQFLAMPLMHSEDKADHLLSLHYFTGLGRRYGLPFARSHARMILRFGRYPHRNAVLGRTSTPAEQRAVAEGNAW